MDATLGAPPPYALQGQSLPPPGMTAMYNGIVSRKGNAQLAAEEKARADKAKTIESKGVTHTVTQEVDITDKPLE